jgi:hypothetical protein
MNESESKGLNALLAIVCVVPNVLYASYVFKYGYDSFIYPFTEKAISFWFAFGLSTFIGMATKSLIKQPDDSRSPFEIQIGYAITISFLWAAMWFSNFMQG